MTTIYLFRTKSGVVYDRTKGRNRRLYFNSKYIIKPHGSFIVKQEESEQIILERYDKYNNLIYKKELSEVGMYVCGPIYAKLAKKTNKYMKEIERYLSNNIGREFYTVNLGKDMLLPFKIQLKTWQDGALRYSFYINLDENQLDDFVAETIIERIEKLKRIDLNRFLMYYMSYSKHESIFTINDDFFETVKSLGIQMREEIFQRTGS